ncbi:MULTISPECIES: helix-turn-helix transcriptional regulator [Paenibacillus]|uniref:helix-turn-helix transcriptional regulator n=1 Tax=Paenibacillus TaxID=44249 RepID=UPI000845D912|nr:MULTISPECIES: YafY family protein [Paenibacillus]AOK91201.1 transcriptional regulator [Paenibacillus polymyxa]MCP3809287.1 YafY family transcriptional regulator [Paenibacillus sp. Lou8.1]
MPLSRHFEIVYMLLHKKKVTADELAEHFEVSTRTIYRDIDTLSAAGIPIYSSRGKGGGISLMEGYVFNTSLLSEQEQDDILMALQSVATATIPQVEEVLNKLSRLFKKDMGNWIEVDFSPWGSQNSQRQLFTLIRNAIITNRVIKFRYYNVAGEQSYRSVEPAKLLFKDKSWYVEGYCLNTESHRVFKISRMKEIAVTETSYEPRTVVASTDTKMNDLLHTIEVTLHISAQGAYRVYDEFAEKTITQKEDGSYTVTAQFPVGNWLDSYLLSFGPLLIEVSPEQVRTRILSHLETMKRNLNDPL